MNIKIIPIQNTKDEIPKFSKYEMSIFNLTNSFEKSWESYLTRYDELFFSYMMDGNKVIGILGWVSQKVSEYPPLKKVGYNSEDKYTFLMAIALDKKYRGKGLSNKLMEYYIEKCKDDKIDILALRVDPINEIAINLYEKFGFKEYDRYGNNLMMSIKISK